MEEKSLEQEKLTDLERLMKDMEEFANGRFTPIDASLYDDSAVGECFNRMLNAHMDRNNRYLARINDAQSRIGDTSCLKSMFEQIEAQQVVVNKVHESRASLEIKDSSLKESNSEFLALSQSVRNAFGSATGEIRNAEDLADTIEIPDPDSLEGMTYADLWDKITQLKTYIRETEKRLSGMERRVGSMTEDALELFDVIDKKAKMNNDFLADVDSLTEGYGNLSGECLDMGRHLYRISRDIDNARNDMYRRNSNPTLHDKLRVFEVDHITLTWRLYNNIVEFESLKLSQVNNPNTCKFGVWAAGEEDLRITESEEFAKAVEAHRVLHEKSVECFEAKQNYDISLALAKFGEAMIALTSFRNAMEDLHVYLRTIGITEETDVWKFIP